MAGHSSSVIFANDRDSVLESMNPFESSSDPWDIPTTANASIDRLRRWRQAALVLNASRRFRYTLDLKKEEERKQTMRKIREHAQAIRAAMCFEEAREPIYGMTQDFVTHRAPRYPNPVAYVPSERRSFGRSGISSIFPHVQSDGTSVILQLRNLHYRSNNTKLQSANEMLSAAPLSSFHWVWSYACKVRPEMDAYMQLLASNGNPFQQQLLEEVLDGIADMIITCLENTSSEAHSEATMQRLRAVLIAGIVNTCLQNISATVPIEATALRSPSRKVSKGKKVTSVVCNSGVSGYSSPAACGAAASCYDSRYNPDQPGPSDWCSYGASNTCPLLSDGQAVIIEMPEMRNVPDSTANSNQNVPDSNTCPVSSDGQAVIIEMPAMRNVPDSTANSNHSGAPSGTNAQTPNGLMRQWSSLKSWVWSDDNDIEMQMEQPMTNSASSDRDGIDRINSYVASLLSASSLSPLSAGFAMFGFAASINSYLMQHVHSPTAQFISKVGVMLLCLSVLQLMRENLPESI